MRFQVPQFIEVEDKIFGPFTFKQFVYLAGGGGIAFIVWQALPTFLALPIIVAVGALSLALAFYKVNERPFIAMIESAFRYFTKSRLYTWKKEREPRVVKKEAEEKAPVGLAVPKVAKSKLKDIAWSLDVQESIYAGGEEQREQKRQEHIFGEENKI